ncbi:MAG: SdrD B-like domain-containing protein [Methanothrix sp.]
MALILMLQILFPLADATQFVGGESYVFSAQSPPIGQNYNYIWTATDGLPQTSIEKSFSWTAPKVTEPTTVEISLLESSGPDGCIAESKLSVLVHPQPSPLVVTKTVDQESVLAGATVTFTLSVKNDGDFAVDDVKLVDTLSPGFIYQNAQREPDSISGNMLTWNLGTLGAHEESEKIILKAQVDQSICIENVVPIGTSSSETDNKLKILATESDPTTLLQIVGALTRNKTKLEVKLDSIRTQRDAFNKTRATLTSGTKTVAGANFTLNNYTNVSTEESLNEQLNATGFLVSSEYTRPAKYDLLTTTYGTKGYVLSDFYTFLPTKETLKIEYNKPEKGYKTYTVRYYATGDTLIITVDFYGNVVSREYRKTPGIAVPKYLTNCATAYGNVGEQKEPVESNRACVDVEWKCESAVGSISGTKFEDKNVNNEWDTNELGLSGWTIELKKEGAEVAITTTGTDGAYSFTGITPGSYTVEEVSQPVWSQTYPVGNVYTVIVSDTGDVRVMKEGETTVASTEVNFGNVPRVDISGIKFNDLNGNGAKDQIEPGLSGWTIKLKKGGTEVDSALTDTGGAYSFTGITPGSYTVEEELRLGWIQTAPMGNVYTVVVSDTGTVTVKKSDSGQTEVAPTEVDFGNQGTGSDVYALSGVKFNDSEGDGSKQGNELLGGWTINLMQGDTVVKTATTSTDTATLGSYRIAGISPGTYTLAEGPSPSSGWTQTYPPLNVYMVEVTDIGQVTVTKSDQTVVPSTDADFGNKLKQSPLQESPLKVTKTTPAVTLIPNMETSFAITVENIGETEIHDISIVDELSPMLEFIPYAHYGDILIQHTIVGSNLNFDLGPLGSLQPGDSWTITYNVKLRPDACKAASSITILPPITATGDTSLNVMAAGSDPADILQIIDALSRNKTKLEAKLKSIKKQRDAFDKANATLESGIKSISGTNYTLSNYTNFSTGETLDEVLNATTVFLVLSEYTRPAKYDILVTTYGTKGEVLSDFYTFLPTKETLKIDYNNPEKGYKTYTVRYYATGDTLILTVDPYGNVVSREYRRTPGLAEPEYLTNCATAYGNVGEQNEPVVSNRACVDLGWSCQSPQPLLGLRVFKEADREIAKPGDIIKYTYTVENTGTIVLNYLTLNDDKLGIIVLNDPEPLDPGESRTYYASYIVKTGDGPKLVNTVVATALDPDGNEVTAKAIENVKILTGCGLTKTASPKFAKPGDYVTYNITWRDIIAGYMIVDDYPGGVSFVSASPTPVDDGKNNKWIIAGQDSGTIIILVQVAQDIGNISFDMGQGVTGTGFVNVHNDIRTEPVILTNRAKVVDLNGTQVNCDDGKPLAASTDVNVGPPQTYVALKEHGSGDYASEDVIKYRNSNHSIEWTKGLTATYKPTSFSLPNNREIDYKTKWIEKAKSKNYATGGSTNEEYTYANRIDREAYMKLDENGSTMKTETDFEGVGHIGLLKKDADANRTWNASTVFEAQEDYVGSFKINERFDEYGRNAEYEKSVNGTGYVSASRDLGKAQSSYESGTGNYRSEEKISTVVNYIAKDINLTHLPTSYNYTPTFSTSSNLLWNEGMWSKTPTSLISERFSSAENLDLQSTARGLNEMVTEASVTGRADFRTIYKDNSPNGTDEIDQEDMYVGKFEITRKTSLGGVAKYDRPHLSLSKIARVDLLSTTFTDYRITIENNGNKALGPVYVKDVFPTGTEFITSSLRPAELTTSYANWSLPFMGIGSKVIIDLQLNLTEEPSNLINRVEAAGKYDEGWTVARNFSTVRLNWLTCCPPQISAAKTAKVDALDPKVVWYRLDLKNREKYTMVAFLMDQLPQPMTLINSSLEPSENRSNLITWTILDLAPGESRNITYRARAENDGVYVNVVHIEAFSVDGPDAAAADVEARIDLGAGGALPSSISSNWQPPTCFGLNCSGQIYSEDWVPCYTCGTGEPGNAVVLPPCASCMSTGDDNLP